MSLETFFWAAVKTNDPFELISVFFDFVHVDECKQLLSEMVLFNHRKEVYKKDYPGQVFVFSCALRSFIRACYLLKFKSKKWKIKKAKKKWSIFDQASLKQEEFENPFLVFERAFSEKTLEDFELFLNEIVNISLSPFTQEFDHDLMTPYINLVKMLDAAQVISLRGIRKIKK